MKISSRAGWVVVLALLQIACSEQAVYTQESFASDSPFKLRVEDPAAVACESARRSLLGQGYLIEQANAEQVKGRKAYRNADDLNTLIEMNVVCIDEIEGSTVFANGVLSTYDLKKSSSSASVGVSAVGSISLPIGQSADSLVKIAEETIDDKDFYSRFFGAVEHTLEEMRARRARTEGQTGGQSAAREAPPATAETSQSPSSVVAPPDPAESRPPGPMGPASSTVPVQTGAPPLDTADSDPRANGPEISRPEINRDDSLTSTERLEVNRDDSRTDMERLEVNRDDSRTEMARPERNRDDAVTAPAEESVP